MSYATVKTFFQAQATANGWEFAHNVEHLSEKIGNELKGSPNFILVMDEPRGRVKYTGQKFDMTAYGFFLLKKVDKGNYDQEDVVYDDAKTALKLIETAMETQKEAESGVMKLYDPGTIEYTKAGPETKARLFGIYVTFSSQEVW